LRDPSLKRYQRALSNQPIKEETSWSGVPAVKWVFPEETFVVGFPNHHGFTLVNLRVPKKLQKRGIGSQVLEWLNSHYPDGIQVQEVQDSAVGFWDKALRRGLIIRYS